MKQKKANQCTPYREKHANTDRCRSKNTPHANISMCGSTFQYSAHNQKQQVIHHKIYEKQHIYVHFVIHFPPLFRSAFLISFHFRTCYYICILLQNLSNICFLSRDFFDKKRTITSGSRPFAIVLFGELLFIKDKCLLFYRSIS